jgi:hypothetical protein
MALGTGLIRIWPGRYGTGPGTGTEQATPSMEALEGSPLGRVMCPYGATWTVS